MLKEYIENHKEEIVTIPMENIVLTEKIHNHGKFTPINKSSDDLINSDVNGSFQIIRKVFPDAFSYGIEVCLTPTVINAVKMA